METAGNTVNEVVPPAMTIDEFIESLADSRPQGFVREITPYFESGN